MIAVILLNHRFPGDMPVAVAALTGSAAGVGVALRRSTGRPVAVSITGPSTRMGAGRLDKLGPRLREVLQASAPPSFTVAPPVDSTDDLYG